MVIANCGFHDALNIEITSKDIWNIRQQKLQKLRVGEIVTIPVILITANSTTEFNVNIQWEDGRKEKQSRDFLAHNV